MFKNLEEHFKFVRKMITDTIDEHTADGTMKIYEALVNTLNEYNCLNAVDVYNASSILSSLAQDHIEKVEYVNEKMKKVIESVSTDTMH